MGYEQSIESQINQLRDVLQRYHGFAVIRELIQNADDAGASRLDIGWVRGLQATRHELLSGGPAVFVLNDGEFTPRNARSIAQLGLSDKAGEHGRIGKFGLGLKSIHHLGEVYFYLSSSSFEGDRYRPNDVQNPWTSRREPPESYRPGWDGFPEPDRQAILERLGPLLPEGHWFCLWVPLRRRHLVGDHHSAIVPEFPGDEDSPYPGIFPPDFEVEVAGLMPFLRKLAEVNCWVEQTGGELQRVSGLRIETPCERVALAAGGAAGRRALAGRIHIERARASGPVSIHFTGLEALVDDRRFEGLASREDWPRPLTLPSSDTPRGRSLTMPEPAVAHAAACFVLRSSEGGPGRLDMAWASYLPVRLPEIPSRDLGSPYHVTLTLHGRFFVDAGRVAVDFGESQAVDGVTVRQLWNDLLRDEGTLGLVLPALRELAGTLDTRELPAVLRDLTAALHGSTLFESHRASICRRHQWLHCHGRTGAAWTLVDADATAHELPEPGPAEPALDEVFPSLADICDGGFCVTYAGWPGLSREERRAPWPETVLLRLLDVKPEEVFADRGRLGLFVRTVEIALGDQTSDAVAGRLCEIARRGMASLGLAGVLRQKDLMLRLLALIPDGRKLSLDHGTGTAEVAGRLIEPLWGEPCDVLVAPIGSGSALPSREAAAAMLDRLLAVGPAGEEGEFLDLRTSIACRIVGHSPDRWEGFDRLPIFPVRAGVEAGLRLVSRRGLDAAREAGLLFVDSHGLGSPLQRALRPASGGELLTITRRSADAVCGREGVPDLDPLNCLIVLESLRPLVDDERPRGDLLLKLLSALGSEEIGTERRSLRYLLHATTDRFSHDEDLFHDGDARSSPVWAGLAARALQQSGGVWRVIPRGLADLLNGHQRGALGIRLLDRPGVVDLLRSVGPAGLDLADLGDDDARTLIEECKEADFDVIRALPIHRSTDGRRVSIDDRCRWQADFQVDGELAENLVVLVPDRRPTVASKQREIHPHSLDARGVIALILEAPSPHLRWTTVLEALAALKSIPPQLSSSLRTTRWIATLDDRPVAPQQVVNSRSLNEAIRDALADVRVDEPEVVSVLELPEPFRSNKVVPGLFPALGDALERLGRVLALDDRYRLGDLDRQEVSLEGLRFAFTDAAQEVMPCFTLLREQGGLGAIGENLDATIEGRLIPTLLGELPASRTATILNYLARRHAEVPQKERGGFFDWFARYFEVASRSGQLDEMLPGISLLSQAGRWEPAEALTLPSVAVEPACLLHPELARLLDARPTRQDGPDAVRSEAAVEGGVGSLDAQLLRGVTDLAAYAEAWAMLPSVPRELVGGLIALLGDAQPMTELATRFLGSFHAASLREQLKWDGSTPFIVKGVRLGGAGISLARTMELRRAIVELCDGGKTRVINLLGRPIEVPVRQEFEDLLLPPEDLGMRDGLRYLRVRLRRLDPARLPDTLDPVAVLRRTACSLLEVVDHQSIPNFDEVWDRLARGEQLDLQVAQRCLQEGLPTVLRGLGLRHREPFAPVLSEWHDANRELAQLEEGTTNEKRGGQARDRKGKARDQLRKLIETDAVAQAECLEAVREEIQRSQYTPESIPFELFQNADDAVAELRTLLASVRPPDDASFRFVVDTDGRSLWFASWGRAINRHQAAGCDGRARGFDQDLEKMLTLGWSDKGRPGSGDLPTTGKFGLGFKSVLLATDRPRVLSGRLAFEVVGGLFPVDLAGGREALGRRLRELGPDGSDGTIVELLLNGISPSEVLGRFRELAPLLVVFGREIHTCVIRDADGRSLSYRWEAMPLEGVPGAEAGAVPGPRQGRILVLRGPSSAAVLALGLEGVLGPDEEYGLPAGWPTFWVTAPTGHVEGLGLAVNAPFELDKGRSHLAYASRRNGEVSAAAGREIGDVLIALHRQTIEDWAGTARAVGLGEEATPLTFWTSIWDQLGRSLAGHHDPHGPLLRDLFWGGPDRAMCRLVSECEALPVGLWGDEGGLTRLDRVRAQLSGILDSEEVFAGVARWPSFRDRHPRGSLVSGRVLGDLRRLAAGTVPDCEKVTLGDAIGEELGSDRRAGPDTATRLGSLVSPTFFQEQRAKGVSASREVARVIEELADVRFLARDGDWYPAGELVVSGEGDEGLRAAFAPMRHVLSDRYHGPGLDFFLACRNQLRADSRTLIRWALEATDRDGRRAVLTYLLQGELDNAVSTHLACEIGGTWLGQLEDESIVSMGFTYNQALVIMGRLELSRRQSPATPGTRSPIRDPKTALELIHEWWGDNRGELVARYEANRYPGGSMPALCEEITRRSAAEDRKGWMVLMILGALHTMGRTHAGSHRNFLVMSEEKGWLEVFSRPTDELAAWMEVLRDYLDENVGDSPYLQWMGQFVSIFQIAHWLHDYVDAFLAIDRFKDDFELHEITATRTAPAFQGGGPDAPPLGRILGFGACFVVRELARAGIISNPLVHRHCFVPSSRARRWMAALGCHGLEDGSATAAERVRESTAIHRFLLRHLGESRATFHGDFDLPLIMLDESESTDVRSLLLDVGFFDRSDGSDLELEEVF